MVTSRVRHRGLSQSEIGLRFHYYENARVDQLATGTLTDFKNWRAAPSEKLNQTFLKAGGAGNLGDRDPFVWDGETYYVQEIQGAVGDWGSWGIYLCDSQGMPLRKLDIETRGKATAFSNPAVSLVKDNTGRQRLIFTAFLHSRGTSPGERGQMLSILDLE